MVDSDQLQQDLQYPEIDPVTSQQSMTEFFVTMVKDWRTLTVLADSSVLDETGPESVSE